MLMNNLVDSLIASGRGLVTRKTNHKIRVETSRLLKLQGREGNWRGSSST